MCGSETGQTRKGYNRLETQRYLCGKCGTTYTIGRKDRAYPEETRELALKMYYSGISGRRAGKVLATNKANAYNWIKNE